MLSKLATLFAGRPEKAIEAAGGVLNELFTSDEERLTRQESLERLRQQPHLLQAMINRVEAAHRSLWVAGWRPGIGWVCALALFTYYIPQHGVAAVLWTVQCWELFRAGSLIGPEGQAVALPPYPITITGLLELVLALLGLGGLRTVEKFGGRTK